MCRQRHKSDLRHRETLFLSCRRSLRSPPHCPPTPAALLSAALSRRSRDLQTHRFGTVQNDGARRRFSDERSEDHTSALQSLMRISYAVFSCQNKNTLSCIRYLTLRHNDRSKSNNLRTSLTHRYR